MSARGGGVSALGGLLGESPRGSAPRGSCPGGDGIPASQTTFAGGNN